MNWIVSPYVGLEPLKFGLTIAQIGHLFDPISPVRATHPAFGGDTVNEYRGIQYPVCNYRDGQLAGVDTDKDVENVFFDNIDIYQSSSKIVLQTLERANGDALGGLGSVLFTKIGVSIGGFYDFKNKAITDDTNDLWRERSLSVFVRGAFDKLIPRYRPITFID